ncbi:hypothetical protein [Ideonella livida]|uniref:Uncharacterized protein n=1 Tax=Ideonella livida TaxID=2707176 RepID=A0A7C9PHS8_9BURK|nr:hypothetical protein [Ideonella livida]NDY91510.1 hypothetical protein [Ideonella livida]
MAAHVEVVGNDLEGVALVLVVGNLRGRAHRRAQHTAVVLFQRHAQATHVRGIPPAHLLFVQGDQGVEGLCRVGVCPRAKRAVLVMLQLQEGKLLGEVEVLELLTGLNVRRGVDGLGPMCLQAAGTTGLHGDALLARG